MGTRAGTAGRQPDAEAAPTVELDVSLDELLSEEVDVLLADSLELLDDEEAESDELEDLDAVRLSFR